MKKIIFLLFIAIGLIVYNFFISTNDELITASVEDICGEYPINYVSPEIGNNPNYIFVSDPNFQIKKIQDEVGNIVYVNSFIECEHYVLGGWNFIDNVNFTASNRNYDLTQCKYSQNLKPYLGKNDKVYIQDISLKQFLNSNSFLCLGKIKSLKIDNNQTNYTVYFSRLSYVLFAQILPLGFLLIKYKIRLNILIIFLVFYQILIQLIFNYRFGLNLLNTVSVFTTLLVIFLLIESQNEEIK